MANYSINSLKIGDITYKLNDADLRTSFSLLTTNVYNLYTQNYSPLNDLFEEVEAKISYLL